jgi:hypothetical protein
MKGEGWKWMGDNQMFRKDDNYTDSDQQLVNANGGEFITEDFDLDGKWNIHAELMLSGDKAEDFMNNLGYQKKPLIADVYSSKTTQLFPDAMGPASVSISIPNEIIEKTYLSTYVNHLENPSYVILGYYGKKNRRLEDYLTASFTEESWQRRMYDYNNVSKGSGIIVELGLTVLKYSWDIFGKSKNQKK